MSRFKTKFCWWPVRLARHRITPERIDERGQRWPQEERTMEFIGWVWLQRAHLTKNLNHGWIAFLDGEPMPLRCKECGQLLPLK